MSWCIAKNILGRRVSRPSCTALLNEYRSLGRENRNFCRFLRSQRGIFFRSYFGASEGRLCVANEAQRRHFHIANSLHDETTIRQDQIVYVESVPVNTELRPYIRLPETDDHKLRSQHSGFTVIFLGTGTGQTLHRSNTATALQLDNSTFLFDAGEGVQRQLMRSRIHIGEIEKIFSTYDLNFFRLKTIALLLFLIHLLYIFQ